MADPQQQKNDPDCPQPLPNDQKEPIAPLLQKKDVPTAPDELGEMKLQIAKLTDIAGRAQADLQNFKERMKRENEEFRKFANAPLLLSLLALHDDLARAAAHEGTNGVKQILLKLEKILAAAGVVKIEAIGKKFDSALHEIVNAGPGEKDVILAIHEEGFLLHGRVLRPAKVQVGEGLVSD